MSAQHTQGRLWVGKYPRKSVRDGQMIYIIEGNIGIVTDYEDWGFTEESARRLAACWNACEGIDTEDLEAGTVSIIQKLHDQAAKDVLAQRDELLAALERLIASGDVRDAAEKGAITQARAAIAKAEGGAA